jgi:hypothetical protein
MAGIIIPSFGGRISLPQGETVSLKLRFQEKKAPN